MEPTAPEGGEAPLCLVADPSPTARRVVRRALAGVGPLVVVEAGTVAAAREAFARGPRFIVVERMFPGSDDLALVREARAREETAGSRILVTGGRRDAGSVRAARAAGADALLLKPFAAEALAGRWSAFAGEAMAGPVEDASAADAPGETDAAAA